MTEAADLIDAVADLGAVLGRTTFPLPAPSAWPAESNRREMAGQLADYLIPRLRTIDAPLLAVVGGSTGAGKSTLINSLVGRRREPGRCAAANHPRPSDRMSPVRPAVVHQ